jgi:hypothetical protein
VGLAKFRCLSSVGRRGGCLKSHLGETEVGRCVVEERNE